MSDLFSTARLQRTRLQKIHGEVFRSLPKERGAIQLSISIQVSTDDPDAAGEVERVMARAAVVAEGIGPEGDDPSPLFRIEVVAEGQYGLSTKASLDDVQRAGVDNFLAMPLYAVAINKIQEVAESLRLPRMHISYSGLYPETAAPTKLARKPSRPAKRPVR